MNRVLLASVASVALASVATAGEWYSSVYGGYNKDEIISAKGVDDQSGYVIGGTVGKKIQGVPGLRIEADLAFRQNEVELFGGFISADHDTTSLLVNAAYDFQVDWKVKPYILAGVGVAKTSATFEDVALLRLESTGLAYQLGAGMNFKVAEGITAGAGYRYFQADEIEVLGLNLSDGTNHSVVAQVTFELN